MNEMTLDGRKTNYNIINKSVLFFVQWLKYIGLLILYRLMGINTAGFKFLWRENTITFSTENLSVRQLKRLTKGRSPAFAREAAKRLYELGEKDYAIEIIIKQMNLYKNPKTHPRIKRETCSQAAKALGQLKDRRAIEPLFEALGELGYDAAYALANIDGEAVEKRLLGLAAWSSKEGFYAINALGFMKNRKVVPKLIRILEHPDDYKDYVEESRAFICKSHALEILGAYRDDEVAEDAFKKYISKSKIDSILFNYIGKNGEDSIYREIVKKYTWDTYLDSEKKKFPFRNVFLDYWSEYSDDVCPFASKEEVEEMRKEVLGKIWNALMNA